MKTRARLPRSRSASTAGRMAVNRHVHRVEGPGPALAEPARQHALHPARPGRRRVARANRRSGGVDGVQVAAAAPRPPAARRARARPGRSRPTTHLVGVLRRRLVHVEELGVARQRALQVEAVDPHRTSSVDVCRLRRPAGSAQPLMPAQPRLDAREVGLVRDEVHLVQQDRSANATCCTLSLISSSPSASRRGPAQDVLGVDQAHDDAVEPQRTP